jgi:hypothetical protein
MLVEPEVTNASAGFNAKRKTLAALNHPNIAVIYGLVHRELKPANIKASLWRLPAMDGSVLTSEGTPTPQASDYLKTELSAVLRCG